MGSSSRSSFLLSVTSSEEDYTESESRLSTVLSCEVRMKFVQDFRVRVSFWNGMAWAPNGLSLSRELWKHPRRFGRLPRHAGSRPVLSGSFSGLLESIRRTLEAIQGAREAARGRWIESGGRRQLFDSSGSRKRRPGSFRHTFPYGWTSRRRGMPPRRLRPPQGSSMSRKMSPLLAALLWLAAPLAALFSASEIDGRGGFDPDGLDSDGRSGFDPNG